MKERPEAQHAMRIDLEELLRSVPAIQTLQARIGLPDSPTSIEVAEPDRLVACLDAAMMAFHELRRGTETLVSAENNEYHLQIWMRVLQNGRSRDQEGRVEVSVGPSFDQLRRVLCENLGDLKYWGGNNYFDVVFPGYSTGRIEFPDVRRLPWDEQYRTLLSRATWSSLRHTVFRFAHLAAALAPRCVGHRMTTVLVPSVGLCVDPWLFAHHGLNVIATDISRTAIETVSEPVRHPNLYSRSAYERWDTAMCADYAMIPHYDHFDGMPALEDEKVRLPLRQRITFALADWTALPVEAGSVDLVYATNALPRESADEMVRVLEEWVRVLRRGGVVFIAQHHPNHVEEIDRFFLDRRFQKIAVFNGEMPDATAAGGFQTRWSSG